MENWQERTSLLAGTELLKRWKNAHVLVVGVGGVGAYAAEQLVRAGIGRLSIVDGDRLHETNLNRQLPALNSTVGHLKTEVLRNRFMDINPNLICETISEYVKDERLVEILQMHSYDYVIDAIDTLSPKIYLLYHSVRLGLPVVSVMGTGGKWDPLKLTLCDIAQTYKCPLADALRKRLHKMGIYTGIEAVFSPEEVSSHAVRVEEGPNKKSTVGTISYMPAMAGCLCASAVLRRLANINFTSDLPIPSAVKKKIKQNNIEEKENK